MFEEGLVVLGARRPRTMPAIRLPPGAARIAYSFERDIQFTRKGVIMFRSFAAALVATTAVTAAALDCTTELHPTADARILSFAPTSNYGHDILSTFNNSGNEQRSLLQFDLTPLPPNATIHSAMLRLYGKSWAGSTAPTSISAYRVARDWLEMEATWLVAVNGQPWVHAGGDFVGIDGSYLTNPYATWNGNQTADYAWYELDITGLVNEQYQGLQPNHGVGLTSPVGCQLVYVQREDQVPPHNPPELVIAYSADTVPGEMNCDCSIDFDDIDAFVLALSGRAAYEAIYPECNWLNADCNGDGTVDFGDIDPFVAILSR
jgi:hypothetical protein